MVKTIAGPVLWCDTPRFCGWGMVYERIDDNYSRVASLVSDNRYIIANRYILWP